MPVPIDAAFIAETDQLIAQQDESLDRLLDRYHAGCVKHGEIQQLANITLALNALPQHVSVSLLLVALRRLARHPLDDNTVRFQVIGENEDS